MKSTFQASKENIAKHIESTLQAEKEDIKKHIAPASSGMKIPRFFININNFNSPSPVSSGLQTYQPESSVYQDEAGIPHFNININNFQPSFPTGLMYGNMEYLGDESEVVEEIKTEEENKKKRTDKSSSSQNTPSSVFKKIPIVEPPIVTAKDESDKDKSNNRRKQIQKFARHTTEADDSFYLGSW